MSGRHGMGDPASSPATKLQHGPCVTFTHARLGTDGQTNLSFVHSELHEPPKGKKDTETKNTPTKNPETKDLAFFLNLKR